MEEAVARRALVDTLSELYGAEASAEAGTTLEHLTVDGIAIAIERYVARYVYTQLLEMMGSRLYESSRSVQDIRRLEEDVRDYVFQGVHLGIREMDLSSVDIGGLAGQKLVEDAFTEGYGFLERL